MQERARAGGRYTITCRESQYGDPIWTVVFDNVVTAVGKMLAEDAFLSNYGYALVGPYLGLISSFGFQGTSLNDTMQSHPGWGEAGLTSAPTYLGARPLAVFTPAVYPGIKSMGPPAQYTITSDGAIKGAFLVLGPGASSTVGNTGGVLYSAGAFAAPQPVKAANVVDVIYSASM